VFFLLHSVACSISSAASHSCLTDQPPLTFFEVRRQIHVANDERPAAELTPLVERACRRTWATSHGAAGQPATPTGETAAPRARLCYGGFVVFRSLALRPHSRGALFLQAFSHRRCCSWASVMLVWHVWRSLWCVACGLHTLWAEGQANERYRGLSGVLRIGCSWHRCPIILFCHLIYFRQCGLYERKRHRYDRIN